jgi:hypothetical protein
VVLQVLPDLPASAVTGIPCRVSSSTGPIPESISSFGLPIAPAQTIISRSAAMNRGSPATRTEMPVAAPSRTTIFSTIARVSTVRFGRPPAGRR